MLTPDLLHPTPSQELRGSLEHEILIYISVNLMLLSLHPYEFSVSLAPATCILSSQGDFEMCKSGVERQVYFGCTGGLKFMHGIIVYSFM